MDEEEVRVEESWPEPESESRATGHAFAPPQKAQPYRSCFMFQFQGDIPTWTQRQGSDMTATRSYGGTDALEVSQDQLLKMQADMDKLKQQMSDQVKLVRDHQAKVGEVLGQLALLAEAAFEEKRKGNDRERRLAELERRSELPVPVPAGLPEQMALLAKLLQEAREMAAKALGVPVPEGPDLKMEYAEYIVAEHKGAATATHAGVHDDGALRAEFQAKLDTLAKQQEDNISDARTRLEAKLTRTTELVSEQESRLIKSEENIVRLQEDMAFVEKKHALQAVSASVFCLKTLKVPEEDRARSLKILEKKEEKLKQALAAQRARRGNETPGPSPGNLLMTPTSPTSPTSPPAEHVVTFDEVPEQQTSGEAVPPALPAPHEEAREEDKHAGGGDEPKPKTSFITRIPQMIRGK